MPLPSSGVPFIEPGVECGSPSGEFSPEFRPPLPITGTHEVGDRMLNPSHEPMLPLLSFESLSPHTRPAGVGESYMWGSSAFDMPLFF